MTSIPIVNVASRKEIRNAIKEFGFFYATGHNVNMSLFDRVYRGAESFFKKPEKKNYTMKKNERPLNGYVEIYGEELEEGVRDRKEYYDMIHPIDDEMFRPNRWDEGNAELMAMEPLMESIAEMSKKILEAYDITFPKDYIALSRILHYPAGNYAQDEAGCGEHIDNGILTVLSQYGKPRFNGLEIKCKHGWIKVPKLSDELLIVNTGALLEDISNGEIKAGLHRVKAVTEERYSHATFVSGDKNYVRKTGRKVKEEMIEHVLKTRLE